MFAWIPASDGCQKILIRAGSAIFGWVLALENFPSIFSIFALWVKKSHRLGSKRGLIYCGSKVCSGWVGSGPISNANIFYIHPSIHPSILHPYIYKWAYRCLSVYLFVRLLVCGSGLIEIQTPASILMKFSMHIPTCPRKVLVPSPLGLGGLKPLKLKDTFLRCSAGCKLTRAASKP